MLSNLNDELIYVYNPTRYDRWDNTSQIWKNFVITVRSKYTNISPSLIDQIDQLIIDELLKFNAVRISRNPGILQFNSAESKILFLLTWS